VHDLEDRQKAIAKTKGEIAKLKGIIDDAPDVIAELETELATLKKVKQELAGQHKVMSDDKLVRLERLPQIIETLKQELANAPGKKAQAENRLNQILGVLAEDDIKDLIARMNLVNERFDQLVATLIRVDSATGINSLTAYIRAENLIAVLKDPNSYWLQLAVVKAGGNNRVKTNLIVDIFTGGSRLSHSGGVIVQYNLYGLTGRSIDSDTFTQYSGYIKAGKIKNLPNPGPNRSASEGTLTTAKVTSN
jgi:hypothetical protein